jgi:hypothetical protein
MIQPAGPRDDTRPVSVRPDSATQSAVRRAVLDATGADDRVQVTNTVATLGWGDVLYVDVYARSRHLTVDDLNPALCRAVAVSAGPPYERVAIKWRLTNS